MKSANGTTTKTGEAMKSASKMSRSGPSQKRISKSANRKSAASQKSAVAGMFNRTHSGPYMGKSSL